MNSFSPEVEVRAVIECQMLARFLYAAKIGLVVGEHFSKHYSAVPLLKNST